MFHMHGKRERERERAASANDKVRGRGERCAVGGLAYRSRSVSNVSWATLNPGEPTKSAIRQCKAPAEGCVCGRVLIGLSTKPIFQIFDPDRLYSC